MAEGFTLIRLARGYTLGVVQVEHQRHSNRPRNDDRFYDYNDPTRTVILIEADLHLISDYNFTKGGSMFPFYFHEL